MECGSGSLVFEVTARHLSGDAGEGAGSVVWGPRASWDEASDRGEKRCQCTDCIYSHWSGVATQGAHDNKKDEVKGRRNPIFKDSGN